MLLNPVFFMVAYTQVFFFLSRMKNGFHEEDNNLGFATRKKEGKKKDGVIANFLVAFVRD